MNVIDEYINQYEGKVKDRLIRIRNIIKANALEASEKISWRMPTFYLNGNLIHFAAMKNHIGLYPGEEAIMVFKDQLLVFKTSKGAIQISHDDELPEKLIAEIVRFRVEKSMEK